MKIHSRGVFAGALAGILAVSGFVLAGGTATAAPRTAGLGKAGHHGGGGGTGPIGNDISYPQCGGAFPSGQAFGIAGVNDGLANTLNPCLGPSSSYPSYKQSELYWAAATSSGALSQPKAQVYVNTADPGNWYNDHPITDWPTSGTNSYGTCQTTTMTSSSGTTYTVGQDSTACAYQYGRDRANQDLGYVRGAVSAVNSQESSTPLPPETSYRYWVDVEIANTWQSGSNGQAMNIADLQGMVDAFHSAAVAYVGVYSTASQWQQIAGGSASGSLGGLDDWVPGASSLSGAQANCAQTAFTGGRVTITQWGSQYDDDYSCVN